MKNNVIYFPYIRVPNNQWFLHVLLYWDSVYAIVPAAYIQSPDALGHNMQELVHEQLVTQIFPGEYTHRIPKFNKAFLDYIDSDSYPVKHGVISHKETLLFNVHTEKLGGIGCELCNRGLARREDDECFSIEAYTANKFMAYLALVLGKLPEINSDPITDSPARLNIMGRPNHIFKADTIRKVILRNLLPVPVGAISASRLAKFKSDHRKDLLRFRNKVETKILEAANIVDAKSRKRYLKLFNDDCKMELEYLTAQMKSKLRVTHVLSIGGIAVSLVGALYENSLFQYVGAALDGLATVRSLGKKTTQSLEHSDVAYAYWIRRGLINS